MTVADLKKFFDDIPDDMLVVIHHKNLSYNPSLVYVSTMDVKGGIGVTDPYTQQEVRIVC